MNTQTQNNDHCNLNNAQTVDHTDTTPPRSESLRVPVRVGKIARLIPSIRNELNQRLENGETGDTILPWLNGLRETKVVLEEHFSDQPINKQNLSDWRRGGFAEWQLRQQIEDDAGALHLHAGELEALEDHPRHFLADDLVTAFTARYASFLLRWDGDVTPQIEAKIKLYSRLRRDLTGLQQSTHWAEKRNEEWRQREWEKDRQFDNAELHYAIKNANLLHDLRSAHGEAKPRPKAAQRKTPKMNEAGPSPEKKSEPPQNSPNPLGVPPSGGSQNPQPSTNSSQAQSSQVISTPGTPIPCDTQNSKTQQNSPSSTPANPPTDGTSLSSPKELESRSDSTDQKP